MYLKTIIYAFIGLQILGTAWANDPGFRVPYRFFKPKALLFESAPSEEKLTKYIKKMAAGRSQKLISNRMLAKEIIYVSQCFDIDTNVFAALIHTESHFNNSATSNTGAVGFTQFTNIGLTEVHDQLGERGKTGAISSTIEFWKEIFVGCIDPEWVPLWKRTIHLPLTLRKARYKQILKTDPNLSLAYGALLLKLYWGRRSQLWDGQTDKTKYEVFLKALARYNGEAEGRAEVYAKKVLDRAQKLYDSTSN